ncbi:NIPSNAP family protein [Oricola thermophila]|uniref:NIPSNAP family protein n=1 Tax=Oricola thermophila TaxID=2742145 RepID=A0A6N1VLR8_9HYPH|nr:NIPSNAP family protein [Oricola thermophila]QKV20169.1 NIPSNAP family protein [Oricola thermophila]
MIYEMRVYRCIPGGLPALLERFEQTTLGIWKRLGIEPVAFFTTVIGESNNDLTYFLAWKTLDERERKWSEFMVDPEWIEARKAHFAKYGEVVANVSSQLVAPTAFSPKL